MEAAVAAALRPAPSEAAEATPDRPTVTLPGEHFPWTVPATAEPFMRDGKCYGYVEWPEGAALVSAAKVADGLSKAG